MGPSLDTEAALNPQMIHDHAFAIAMHLLSVFSSLLREEERRDAFEECYDAAKAGLECYELMSKRKRIQGFGASAN